MKQIKLKYHISFWLLSALIVFSFYFFSDAINCGDLPFHHGRIQGITDALQNGSLKQWIYYGNFIYGYQTPVYYSDILFIPFCMLTFLNIPDITILQIIIFVTYVVTFYTAYHFYNKKFNDNKDAFLFAILYGLSLLSLNRMMYCAIGRMMTYAFIPFLISELDSILKPNSKWYKLSIAISLICYSNTVMCIIIGLFVIIHLAANMKTIKSSKIIQKNIIKAGCITFALSSFVLMPFIEGMLSSKNASFLQHSENAEKSPHTLIKLLANILPQLKQVSDIFANNIIITVITSITFVVTMILYWKLSKNQYKKYLIIGLSILFVSTEMFPWQIIHSAFPFLLRLELPFRLAILFESYFLIYIIKNKKDWNQIVAAITIAIIGFLLFKPFTGSLQPLNDEIMSNPIDTTAVYGFAFEYMPVNYVETLIANELDENKTLSDIQTDLYGICNNIKNNPVQIDGVTIERLNATNFIVNYENLDKVEIPLFFYNGYKITEDGKELQYEQSDNGFMLVNPIHESCTLRVEHVWTPIQVLSAIITALSMLYILGAELGSYHKRKSLRLNNMRIG